MSQSQRKLPEALLFCDGASRGNPGPSGWGFVLAFGERVIEGGGGSQLATNNQMELQALTEGIEKAREMGVSGILHIFLDSQYVLNGAEKYRHAWRRNGWQTKDGQEVKNVDLWKKLDLLLSESKSLNIKWEHVRGHRGIPGNERCDKIASSFADGKLVSLFDGPLAEYPVNLSQNMSTVNSFPAPIYLSLVGGKVFRDKTWKECEARVRGQRSAKYKKVHNNLEEADALSSWGVKIDQ